MSRDIMRAMLRHYLHQAGRADEKKPEYGRRKKLIAVGKINNRNRTSVIASEMER